MGIRIPEDLLQQAKMIRPAATGKEVEASAQAPPRKLAVMLFNESIPAREVFNGVMDELNGGGFLGQNNITVQEKNAQNEFTMAQSVAQDIVRQKFDFIITLSTPALQVMAQANKDIPHVFGFVTDPYRMGVARNSREHLPTLTGVATFQPVEAVIRSMREIFPQARRIGIVWNPAEACSEACTFLARDRVAAYGFELLEATVSTTAEVNEAVRSLVTRGVDLFFTSGDNTVNLTLPSVAAYLKQCRIPYFTNTPSDVEQGAFMGIGADYREVGKETARVAKKVIGGEKTANIPIEDFLVEKMFVNQQLAEEYGVGLPESVLRRAAYIKR
jgi:ABC-type uncharacterized transport system substrate-binding protein